ncbi:MAG: VCBS domain-containing protein, partial [Allosphingosinicella sp.]
MPTYTGTNGDNHINGSNSNDIIFGLGGHADLNGKKGDDQICGGAGNDELHGDQGNDKLYGEQDNDLLYGDSGNDELYGGDGHDGLFGGDGNDHLTGGGGLDFLDGGSGFDTAYYSGSILEYDFYTAFGLLAVVHLNGLGADGADALDNIEQLVFADAVINIGANNAPIAVNDSAATNEDAGVYSSGTASVTDNDFDFDGDSLTVTAGTFVGTYGTLNLNADGTYTYTLNAAAQALGVGQNVQDVFNYTVSDGSLTDGGTLTINVAGVNDAPTIDAGGTDAIGSVTELPQGDPDENAFTHQDSGTIAFDDVDTPDTHSASFTPQGVGYLGTFTLDPVNQAGDTVGWDFSIDDSAIDFLDEGEVLVQTYTIQISDGNGGFVTQDVTITITGAGDVVVPDGFWFIDNSAVGSANLGTQDDPYTSIAAFNAAQGTLGGPAPGDTIYLREGLGTYAEADGINLLDGQVLVGGGEDLVAGADTIETATGRPTIVVTGPGNHGVELALDNSLSGFDIGDTTGAGIADGGGTVGTLTVSGIAKSGTGQIVDIDQGGTVSITLDSAASTVSTGGAIDLAGIGGSFTVTGATNIAGIHSGGGVDITATSLAVTLAGGGLVSTGAATGINYVGNSGSLTLSGGGFDIATSSATALNAQSGGTVAIGGAGNKVTSTTGTAVHIANTTSLGVTLESVSSSGGTAAGIILDNAGAGGFTVTGLGSAATSGGTISGKNGADGSLTQGIGIVISDTSNVSLANMAISSSQNYGIRGDNVVNFTLRDSSVTGTHGTSLALDEGAVSFTNLSGVALFEGNLIAGGFTDNLRIANDAGALDLTIQDSAANDAIFGHNGLTGEDSLHLETDGTASLTALIDGVEVQGARGDMVEISAFGSSTQDIEIHDSVFHNSHANIVPGGGGVLLAGAGSDIEVDFLIEGSSFRGADGNALSASYTQDNGAIQGRLEGNVIGINDGVQGVEGSSGGGVGIFASLQQSSATGDASFAIAMVDNQVYDVAFGLAGIYLNSSGGGASNPAILEATLTGNTIADMGDFSLAGLYAIVGGSAGSGDFAQMGLDLQDNVIDASGIDFANAVFLDQVSVDAHYYFPGYA